MMKVSLIIPTYNAGDLWKQWIAAYQAQSLKADQVIVVDSDSSDQTSVWAEQAGFFVAKIAKEDFNHGGTRNFAISFADCDILVFMTQDAILANENALADLLEVFNEPDIAAAYGRQLPHQDANSLAIHARLFNYPAKSEIKSVADVERLGIKTVFFSNSFAAYRKSVFEQLNGFPNNTILAEDMYLAAKIVLAGYKIAYQADAQVFHSHNYSLIQEFRRYFDTGVFQKNESWIPKTFGKARGEGKKFVISEINYLLTYSPFKIPKAICSTICKYTGFKLGMVWQKLPKWLTKRLSMHRNYWK